MTPEEADKQAMAVAKWMDVWEKKFKRPPRDVDAMHSSLLRRLLAGEPFFEKEPPRRYSYPSYGLAAGNPVKIDELFEMPGHGEFDVCIDQHVGYKWKDKSNQLLEHKNGDLFKFDPATKILQKATDGNQPT